MVKLKLNSLKILNNSFKFSTNGYNSFDVDVFLDKIIEDYREVEDNVLLSKKEYNDLVKKISELEENVKKLEVECSKQKNRLLNIKDSDNVTKENVEIIKKVNAYEKFLWKKGFDPKDIIK